MLTAHPPRTSSTTRTAAVARGCDYDYRYCQPANCTWTWTVDGGLSTPDRGWLAVGVLTGSRQGPLEALRAAELELNYVVPDPCMHACGCAGGLAHRSPTRPSLISRGSHPYGSIAARRTPPAPYFSLIAHRSLLSALCLASAEWEGAA